MKYLLITLLAFCALSSKGQSIDEAFKLYQNKQYDEALALTAQMIKKGGITTDICALTGRIYVDIGEYDSSISFLQCAIERDSDQTFLSAWSHAYLGKAYVAIGDKKKGIPELRNAVRLNKTRGSTAFALQLLEYVADLPDWIVVKKEHINYYFQDTAKWSAGMQRFIAAHEAAYVSINNVFKAQLPRKLSFYVWKDTALSNKILKHPLGFTNMRQCVSNVTRDQTIGHEMTHTLSYWGWGVVPQNETRFISEGVAVAFDLRKGDKMLAAKAAAKKAGIRSVTELWASYASDDAVLYPVAGAFVAYMYKKSTAEQFKLLIKDQIMLSAEKNYGKPLFDRLVKDFDALLLAK